MVVDALYFWKTYLQKKCLFYGNNKCITVMATRQTVRLFFCGDVMLARGIDMIQRHSCDPVLYEGNGLDAHGYVMLAKRKNGPIPPPEERGPAYIWGDALEVLRQKSPTIKIINLETSITTSSTQWPDKGIHYRMHPKNVDILQAAEIDCCILANNHTADWGFSGLLETLDTLKDANIKYSGAGKDATEAESPAVCLLPGNQRLLVFSAGHWSSGVPDEWKATSSREGVNILSFHQPKIAAAEVKKLVSKHKKDGDIVVLSVHWGGNWGFRIENFMSDFSHRVIDEAGVDIVHGHSSHHVKAVELYKGKVIMYGCGDFINDYEGIGGQEDYRGDLALMYFVTVDMVTRETVEVTMVPTETRLLRVNYAHDKDINWLESTMNRECKKFGGHVYRSENELKLKLPETQNKKSTTKM